MKLWLQDIDIEMYSTRKEGTTVVTERFIRALKSKFYKYVTSLSKNVHIDKLDEIVNKYNCTCNSTTNTKPVDVNSSTHFDFSVENNDKDPKFKVGGHIKTPKNKNSFPKGYTPNWAVFVIKKV